MTTEQRSEAAGAATSMQARMVIGGESVDALDGQTFTVTDPARGVVIATAPQGGKADVDRAVAAALAAYEDPKGWSSWSASKRGRTLMKLSNLVKQHLEELAQLECRNGGKPINGARGEILGVSLVFEYYAGAANKVFGETIPVSKPGLDFTLREPIGVVGLIVPWNFPLLMAAWKLGPGAGGRQHGHPQARVVHAADRAAASASWRSRPASRPASSTSSPGPVARPGRPSRPPAGRQDRLHRRDDDRPGDHAAGLGRRSRRSALELGGKSPNIVFADADLERFARESPYAVFDNAGQDCCARSRDPRRALGARSRRRALRRGDAQGQGRRPDGRSAPRWAASSARSSASASSTTSASARKRARSWSVGGTAPHADALTGRRLPAADGLRRRRERHAHLQRGDLRPGRRRSSPSRPRRKRSRLANDTPYGLSGSIWSARHRPRAARGEGHPRRRPERQLQQLESTPRRPSAATRCRATAASSACTPWSSTPRSRTSSST